jgi:hypothetical protein
VRADAVQRLRAPARRHRVLRVAQFLVRHVGGLADRIAVATAKRGPLLRRIGQIIGRLFGSETLRRTSISITGSLVLRPPFVPPGWLGSWFTPNLGGNVQLWSGSVEYYEEPNRFHDRRLTRSISLNTPWGSFGYSNLSGENFGLSPFPFLGGYYATSHLTSSGPRAFGVNIGMRNVATLALGQVNATEPGQYARGPFVDVGGGFGLLGFGVALYYPPLEALTKHLEGPARALQGMTRAITERITAWWHSWFPEAEAEPIPAWTN